MVMTTMKMMNRSMKMNTAEKGLKPSTTYLEYKGFNGVANYDVVFNSVMVCL